MMRLAQRFGTSVYDELVKTWLPAETAAARGDWSDVTFRDACDMMTGNYDSANYQQDEDRGTTNFFTDEIYWDGKLKGKLSHAIGRAFSWRAKVAPGTKHVYHSGDTMIATSAMAKYLASKAGPGEPTDLWDMVVEDILRPLNVQSGALTSVRTYDAVNVPYGGYGLFWIQDDIAKIANFMLTQRGVINGVQVLHRDSVDAAMQRNGKDRGLDCDYPANFPEPRVHRYNYGIWSQEYPVSQVPGCAGTGGDTYYQPYFSGYGGIRVVLMGNGAAYYYFSDNGEFEFTDELVESAKLAPLCEMAVLDTRGNRTTATEHGHLAAPHNRSICYGRGC